MLSKWPCHINNFILLRVLFVNNVQKRLKSLYKSRNKPNIPGRKLFAFVRVVDLFKIWFAVAFIFSFQRTRIMGQMYSPKVPEVSLHKLK